MIKKIETLLTLSLLSLVGAGAFALGCGSDPVSAPPATASSEVTEADQAALVTAGCACSLPTSGVYATFKVGAQTFSQQITNASAISDVIAVWRGKSNKHIPVGRLECACTGWNCNWNWRMRPSSVTMASNAIELCDGLPSAVNADCTHFGGGSYCPWLAQLTGLRDCRISLACPTVPK